MKSILIIVMLLFTSFMVNGQRNIHLLHGYGGVPEEWTNYDVWLESQNAPASGGIVGHQIIYRSGRGLDVPSTQGMINAPDDAMLRVPFVRPSGITVGGLMPLAGVISDPLGIGIGQSMGGLVLRTIDRNNNGSGIPYGGYITCGTPNLGLPMVAAMTPDPTTGTSPVEDQIAEWMETFAEGPIETANLPTNIVNNSIAAINTVADFIANIFTEDADVGGIGFLPTVDLAEFIQGPLNAALGGIDNPLDDVATQGSLTDLPPNSDYINTINSYTSNLPTIGIWGNEHQNAHYRIACSAISWAPIDLLEESFTIPEYDNRPYNFPLYNKTDQSDFNGISEGTCLGAIAGVAGVYEAFSEFNYNLADLTTFFGLLWLDTEDSPFHAVGEAYERGFNLLTHQSELDYLILIQAFEETISTVTIEVPAACNDFSSYMAQVGDLQAYIDCVQQPGIITSSEITYLSSDGLVPEWSQLLPNAVTNREVEGANHFEYFNHPNMTNELDFILGNTTAPDPFFRTIQ